MISGKKGKVFFRTILIGTASLVSLVLMDHINLGLNHLTINSVFNSFKMTINLNYNRGFANLYHNTYMAKECEY